MNAYLVAAALSICSRHVAGPGIYEPGFEQCEVLNDENHARAVAARAAADAEQNKYDLDAINRAIEELRKK